MVERERGREVRRVKNTSQSFKAHQRCRVEDGSVLVDLDSNLLLVLLPPVSTLGTKHLPHQLQQSVTQREGEGGRWITRERGRKREGGGGVSVQLWVCVSSISGWVSVVTGECVSVVSGECVSVVTGECVSSVCQW